MPLTPEEIAKIQEEERIRAEQSAKYNKTINPKKVEVALFLSIIPGLGQIYKGETIKGLFIFLFAITCQPLFGQYVLVTVYIWQMLDAYGILSISKSNIKKISPVLKYLFVILLLYSFIRGIMAIIDVNSVKQPEPNSVSVDNVPVIAKSQTKSGNDIVTNIDTVKVGQQALENNLKGVISKFEGGNTKVSYGELRLLGSDETDVPAGSNVALVDVVLGDFSDKNILIKNITNPLTFKIMEAAFADKNVNSYLVNVIYTVNIPSGNSRDTEIVNYGLLKSTYNDTKWTKPDVSDLCNVLDEKDKSARNNPDYLGGNGCYVDK